jgi:hypothetical protein
MREIPPVIGTATKTWICPSCGEFVDVTFAICYGCGTSRTGQRDSSFRREIDAAVEAELALPDAAREPLESKQQTWQFTLRELLVVVFVLCGAMAIARYFGIAVWLILLCILAANLFGVVVGWFVTCVFGLPNDGSNPTE